jgi:hypothetical protein
MINRSSNVSARRAANGSDNNDGGGADNHQPTPSKTKDRKSTSRRSSSFMLPFLIASFTLLMMVGRPLLLPSSSSSSTTQSDDDDAALQLRSSSTKKNEPSNNNTSSKYKLTPQTKFPKNWKTYSYDHIRHHFNCQKRSRDMNKPLPTLEDWNFLRRTYKEIVVDGNKGGELLLPWEEDLVPPTLGYSFGDYDNEDEEEKEKRHPTPPPYYAKLSPGKGRGLFASHFIPKGSLVHDGTKSDVIFPSARKFREYIFSLPRNYACDAAEWVWMQQLTKDGPYHLLMGINISSLMNSGGADWGDKHSKTVNTVPETEYSGKFYAVRDIREGEEILTDYDVYLTKWPLVGLGEGKKNQ